MSSSTLANIGKKILIILGISIALGIAGYSIDHAYFNYPLGTGIVGISAKDHAQFPATSEISFIAKGIDQIQIDLSAKKQSQYTDLQGEIEVLGPKNENCLTTEFNVKKYPSGFLPNPKKWQTLYARNPSKGEYKLRITQYKPGEVNVYFYQGPFLLRFALLPIVSIFIYFLFSFTFERKTIKDTAVSTDNE